MKKTSLLILVLTMVCAQPPAPAAEVAEVRIDTGAPPKWKMDPGWDAEHFPEHAVCYKKPKEIAEIYAQRVVSYPKPEDGSLRIVGTGHSFMAPGYKTFPAIARAAGFKQPPLVTHTGGGMTGSAPYKWEQENGIFRFDGEPRPKMLASLAHAQWDAMMWGPFYHDRPEYYACWIDFCLKYNPKMRFYLMNAWPQIGQLHPLPKRDDEMAAATIARMGKIKQAPYESIVGELNRKYDNRVFILPTCEAMVLAAEYFHRGELPGVEGIHRLAGGKERSLWRDRIGHLGPGMNQLEGYVFYATLYGRSPELIEDVAFGSGANFPSRKLDRTFRKIAWQAVLACPLSGVVDKNSNGIGDAWE